jgi:hypothetical protein
MGKNLASFTNGANGLKATFCKLITAVLEKSLLDIREAL